MKNKAFTSVISLILCFAVIGSLLSVASLNVFAAVNTVIATDAVRLRSTPAIENDNVIATLSKGETLTLLSDSSDGWANVKRNGGATGYCSIDYLNVPSGSVVKFEGKVTDDVNFRSSASTSSSVIKVLTKGTTFSVSDNSDELWVKAVVSSKTGYIYREYVSLSMKLSSDDSNTTPSVQKPDTPDWYSSSLLQGAVDISADKSPLSGEFALSHSSIKIDMGESFNLSVYANGGSLDNTVKFSTSDKSVATVSGGGIVKGVKTGSATITAKLSSSGQTAECKVTVSSNSVDITPELTISKTSLTMEKGTHYQLTASEKGAKWTSSDTSVVTVSGGIVTAKSVGSALITATYSNKSATCSVEVKAASSDVTIKYSTADIPAGKTLYNGVSTSAEWTSSDENIATVSNGFITGVSKGKAVITARTSKGIKTCLVNIEDALPVRFAYATPNTAAKNEKITLIAITDTKRTAVQFKVNVGGSIKTVDATSKSADGNTLIWKGSTTISSAGEFEVKAYAKVSSGYETCDDSTFTVFVRNTSSLNAETSETRRASDNLISLVADFEGYSGNVYFDNIAGGIPTLGYGKVVYMGDKFYNDMTKTEAYALLVASINNDGYASNVCSYLQSLDANFNQHQFDAFVSFAYNIGYYGFKSDSEIRALIRESVNKVTDTSNKNSAYVNGTNVNLRSGAGTSYSAIDTVNYPDALTLLSTELVNKDWYHVRTSDGVEGYIYKDYVTKGVIHVDSEVYLSLINKSELTRVLLEYHHAGSSCIKGLLWRRVDELDLFYYNDYKRDGDKNRYGYSFVCKSNPSIYI